MEGASEKFISAKAPTEPMDVFTYVNKSQIYRESQSQ